MTIKKSDKDKKLKTICIECGHDWLREIRSFDDCPHCLAYLMQAKQNPELHRLIQERYNDKSCHLCADPLGPENSGIKSADLIFCSLDCAVEHKRLNLPG